MKCQYCNISFNGINFERRYKYHLEKCIQRHVHGDWRLVWKHPKYGYKYDENLLVWHSEFETDDIKDDSCIDLEDLKMEKLGMDFIENSFHISGTVRSKRGVDKEGDYAVLLVDDGAGPEFTWKIIALWRKINPLD